VRALGSLVVLAVLLSAAGRGEAQDDSPSPVEKAKAMLLSGGEALFKEALDGDERKATAERLGVTVEEVYRKLAEMIMNQYAKEFTLTEEDAKRIAKETFDDKENLKSIRAVMSVFEELKLPLPHILDVIVKRVQDGSLTQGSELEFAARFVAGVLAILKKQLK